MEGLALPSVGTITLALKAFFYPQQAQNITEIYELHLGTEVLQVQIKEGELHVQQGQTLKADAVFQTNIPTYIGLFSGQLKPEVALAGGLIRVEGEPGALNRFLSLSQVPPAPQ